MASWDEKLKEWWDQSNMRNMVLPAAQSAMPYLPGGMLSNMVEAEGENLVNLLGGQETPAQAYSHSPLMQSTVEPLRDFGSMVGRALQDPGSLWDVNQETGEAHIGQGPIEAAAGAAMTIPMAGLASGAGRASQLASGPLLDSLKWKLESHANQLGMHVDDLAQNVMNNPENWPDLTAQHGPHIEAAAEETYGKLPPLEHDYYDLPEAGIYPTDSHGMAYDPADIQPPLKTLGDGSVLTSEELNHLMDAGYGDIALEQMTLDQAHTALENTGYYPDVLGGENWTPAGGGQLPAPPSQINVPLDKYGEPPGNFKTLGDGLSIPAKDWYLIQDTGHDPGAMNYKDASALLAKVKPKMEKPNLAQKPYYGTGSQEMDDLIAAAGEKGWDPHTLAGKYTAGELSEMSLHYHSMVDASNVVKGSSLEPLVKGYTAPPVDPLKPKPLQPGIAPWAQTPAIPLTSIQPPPPGQYLAHGTPEWEQLMRSIYAGGENENELLKEFLGNQYNRRGEAAGAELLSKYPSGGNPRSTIIPHGFYTGGSDWRDRVDAFLQRGFPGDAAARQRAEDMGIDLDTTLWHAGRHPMLRFRDPTSKGDEQAIFLSKDPDIAKQYGKYLYPLHPRLDDPLVKDWGGREWNYDNRMQNLIDEARGQGKSYAIGTNMRDIGGLQDQYMMLDTSAVRSPWAQFDPKKKGSIDWLAAGGVPFNPFDFLAQTEEQRRH